MRGPFTFELRGCVKTVGKSGLVGPLLRTQSLDFPAWLGFAVSGNFVKT
jgi:hypothetical protein